MACVGLPPGVRVYSSSVGGCRTATFTRRFVAHAVPFPTCPAPRALDEWPTSMRHDMSGK
jgi:hypothetical protein